MEDVKSKEQGKYKLRKMIVFSMSIVREKVAMGFLKLYFFIYLIFRKIKTKFQGVKSEYLGKKVWNVFSKVWVMRLKVAMAVLK